ncbi:hypothetical protein [Cupriavidus basilensis]|uniref:hypothetical protein n=1 Tax=Cupriavidus basilensis TaxID=68895 RepID=UPI0007513B08|nr:hypothetical protein [Cupriavidus basilensis]
MSSNNITTVRQHLLDTLADLRNRETPMDIDRARAVADVARVLVDSAKVEVDYLKATGANVADFFEGEKPAEDQTKLPAGITGVTRHLIR